MSKIAIFNQKGGVGKTTTAINLSYALKLKGYKVLLIDLDPQANATVGIGVEENPESNIYSVLLESEKVRKIITSINGVDLLPSSLNLANAEIELSNLLAREKVLDRALKTVEGEYDYIIIDCPPNLGLLSINALSTADHVIVPIYPSFYSIQGLASFKKYFGDIKANINEDIKILGYVITKFDERKNIHKSITEELTDVMKDEVLLPYIRTNSKLEESQEKQVPIFDLDPKNKGAEDYLLLSEEIIRRVSWKQKEQKEY